MIKIAHASISEHNTVNGKAGDQTHKEVCVRDWYKSASKPWTAVLRHPDDKISFKMADYALMIAENDCVGYSQAERNTLYKQLELHNFDVASYLASNYPTNTDCSAFMTAVAVCAGIDRLRYTSNAPTTRSMVLAFKNAGFNVLTDSQYLDGYDYLRKGDILVRDGHTVIVLNSGDKSRYRQVIYYPQYTGKSRSFVEALVAVGVKDTSFEARKQIAEMNGYMRNAYSGSATQNSRLLSMLKDGKLTKEIE